jgi:UDP-glucose 4-epimerase
LTINDLARKIIELTGSSSSIEYAQERPGDVKHSMASVDKITAAGFHPASSFDSGLQATIEYFLKG